MEALPVYKLIPALFALVLAAQIAGTVRAAGGAYIQINNGRTISITESEQPQIVAQFGNQGARIDDVRVVCNWNNRIRFNGQAQNGPFPSSQFVVPGFNGLASVFYPANNVTDPAQLPDLPTGQNYNVALGIRLAPPAVGTTSTLRCFLLDKNAAVLAESQPLTVSVR
jgi:hypothetical protein